jgi:predicted phosphoribosyltransferase
MLFQSRQDAGRKLGNRLRELAVDADVVAGLPRGGITVAAAVADILQRPLEAIVVRKIGHPWHREFAVGALAEEDVVILNRAPLSDPFSDLELQAVIEEEQDRLRVCCAKFHEHGKASLAGLRVLVVDDGLATGATAEAAVEYARKKHAREVTLAVPVASTTARDRLLLVADRVIALHIDPDFEAVGQYYRDFLPITDEEVLALLHRHPAGSHA